MEKKKLQLLILFAALCAHTQAQWTMLSSGSATNKFESVYFWDANNGIFSSSGGMIKTSNGGTTWAPVSIGGVRDIDFVSTTNGFAAGISSQSLKKTINGGSTWTALTPINSSSLWGVSVISTTTAYVCGVSGIVWKTVDGGTTWTAVNLGVSDLVVDLQFLNATTGCALDQVGKVYRTTNGGTTWTITYTGTGSLFTSIYFVTATTGYAVGSNGRIIKTTDGGLTWTTQTSGSTAYLQYVHFIDANNGITVGFGGTVLRTTNGGTTWFSENTGTTKTFNSCIMLSNTVAIIAGDSGVVMRNTNLLSGIEENIENAQVTTYPNPFSVQLNCTISGDFTDNDLILELYDLAGKLVLSKPVHKDNNSIETELLPSGTYMYAVKRKGILISQGKIIKTN
jgi:photosystem II stability/assembly factor-like uncharacterized protein